MRAFHRVHFASTCSALISPCATERCLIYRTSCIGNSKSYSIVPVDGTLGTEEGSWLILATVHHSSLNRCVVHSATFDRYASWMSHQLTDRTTSSVCCSAMLQCGELHFICGHASRGPQHLVKYFRWHLHPHHAKGGSFQKSTRIRAGTTRRLWTNHKCLIRIQCAAQ